MNKILEYALAKGYIEINPCASVPAVKGARPKKRHPASDADVEKIEQHKTDSLIARLYYFMEYTGCRIGELAGLCWQDVDFDEGHISVGRSLTYRPDKDNKSRFHTSTVKTEAGVRQIPMFDEVRKTLQELYDHQENNGFCTKEIDGTSGFILSGRFGNVIKCY